MTYRIKNTIIKPLIGLAMAITLTGCDKHYYNIKKERTENLQRTEVYDFTNFGNIGPIRSISTEYDFGESSSISLGDIDGDGDNDIAIGTTDGRIILFENKMPQKNKSLLENK